MSSRISFRIGILLFGIIFFISCIDLYLLYEKKNTDKQLVNYKNNINNFEHYYANQLLYAFTISEIEKELFAKSVNRQLLVNKILLVVGGEGACTNCIVTELKNINDLPRNIKENFVIVASFRSDVQFNAWKNSFNFDGLTFYNIKDLRLSIFNSPIYLV